MGNTLIPELCPQCQQAKEEEEKSKRTQTVKNDSMEKRRLALEGAEKCRFFCHHTMYDKNGQPESGSLIGQRTCSLTIKAKCGHELSKYNLCLDWFDGKDCPDWAPKEVPGK